MKKNLLFCLLISTLIFSNCKKNDLQNEEKSDDYTSLLKMGFDTTRILDMKDYYLVEGDIVIYKSDLSKTVVRQVSGGNDRLVGINKQRNITIRIDNSVYNSGSNFNWSIEVPQAIAEYNNLETSNIRFTIVSSSSADIVIKTGAYDEPTSPARAPLPNGGNTGSYVEINTSYSGSTLSSIERKYALMHELGHTIGLRHTDWYDDPNASGTFDRIGVSPNSNLDRDNNSIFNWSIPAFISSSFSFSDWDIYALSVLYPSTSLTINGLSATCSSGNYNLSSSLHANFSLTWNTSAPTSNTVVTGNTLQIINAETINRKISLSATIDYLGNQIMTVQKNVQAGALSPWDYNIKFLRPGTGVHCGNGNYIVDGVPSTDYTALEIISNSSTLTISQMYGSPMFYASGVSSNPYSNAIKVRFQNSCGWGNWGIYYLQPC